MGKLIDGVEENGMEGHPMNQLIHRARRRYGGGGRREAARSNRTVIKSIKMASFHSLLVASSVVLLLSFSSAEDPSAVVDNVPFTPSPMLSALESTRLQHRLLNSAGAYLPGLGYTAGFGGRDILRTQRSHDPAGLGGLGSVFNNVNGLNSEKSSSSGVVVPGVIGVSVGGTANNNFKQPSYSVINNPFITQRPPLKTATIHQTLQKVLQQQNSKPPAPPQLPTTNVGGKKCTYVQMKGAPLPNAAVCHKGGMACEKQCGVGSGIGLLAAATGSAGKGPTKCTTVVEEVCEDVKKPQCKTVLEPVCEPVTQEICDAAKPKDGKERHVISFDPLITFDRKR